MQQNALTNDHSLSTHDDGDGRVGLCENIQVGVIEGRDVGIEITMGEEGVDEGEVAVVEHRPRRKEGRRRRGIFRMTRRDELENVGYKSLGNVGDYYGRVKVDTSDGGSNSEGQEVVMDEDSPVIINYGEEIPGDNRRDSEGSDKQGGDHEGMEEVGQIGIEESEEEVVSDDGMDGVGFGNNKEEGENYG